MLKRYLLFSAFAGLALGTPLAAQADDQVRSAQQALAGQGFYNGAVDGELNKETQAAIRRYQIRNGLDGTGELTPDTVKSLQSPAAAPEATPEPLRAPTPAPAAVVPPPSAPAPENPPPAVRPGPPSGATDPAFAHIYARSPYVSAPAAVQRDTLRKAQMLLARRGFYSGEVNGFPGPDTEEALIRFQSTERLPRTGCMDIDTLARLHLLPVARVIHPRGYPPGEGPGPAVRGIPAE